jgi:hypothetical protein
VLIQQQVIEFSISVTLQGSKDGLLDFSEDMIIQEPGDLNDVSNP